jgi:hypothetical protein
MRRHERERRKSRLPSVVTVRKSSWGTRLAKTCGLRTRAQAEALGAGPMWSLRGCEIENPLKPVPMEPRGIPSRV